MSVLLCLSGELEVQVVERLATLAPPIEVTRRCADLTELVACAQAGLGTVAVVDDIDLVDASELRACGLQIVGVLRTLNPASAREVGCDAVASPFADDVAACLQNLGERPERERTVEGGRVAVKSRAGEEIAEYESDDERSTSLTTPPSRHLAPGVASDATLERELGGADEFGGEPDDGRGSLRGDVTSRAGEAVGRPKGSRGKIIAVWGSGGSPGRSCVARDLAHALGERKRTLLIDADIHHPSLAQLLALDQETSAIVAVARAINMGEKAPEMIKSACVEIATFDFLPGLNAGHRWREIPRPVADRLWEMVRDQWDYVVVDCAAEAESQGYGFETERDGLTLSLLESADDVLVVGRAGPVGLRRLVDHVARGAELGVVDPHVVVTRTGRHPMYAAAASAEVLTPYGIRRFSTIREDRERMVDAECRGLTLQEAAANSGIAQDIAALAGRFVEDEVVAAKKWGVSARKGISVKKGVAGKTGVAGKVEASTKKWRVRLLGGAKVVVGESPKLDD
ncbi:MAG: hypothetical protein QM705_07110 [Ancrocorticia sp.]